MILRTDGCELYRVGITTTPPLPATSWEASFDDGATWSTCMVIDGNPSWLVAGPAYTGDGSPTVVPRGYTIPILRCVDDPETVKRAGPRIEVDDAF